MRLRFWLLAMDVINWLSVRLNRLYLVCVVRASDATDWGDGSECPEGTGEPPF